LHGKSSPPQDAPLLGAERPALRGGQGYHGVGMRLGCHHISAILADEGPEAFRIRQTGEMLPLPGQDQSLLIPLSGLVGIT
jgi:hypothetical protein